MKKFLMFFAALAVVFQSCEENHDDLWSAIDDLDARLTALETQVEALNDNVEALGKLYNGATIQQVAKEGDTYVLTLSNGEVIRLTQGSVADAVIPIFSINAAGEWQYSVDNGATWLTLEGSNATAEDGRTPQFRVDETTGYWQYRYADDEPWSNVVDAEGNPVAAVGEGGTSDPFFESVYVDGDMLIVVMKSENEEGVRLEIPILRDFLCRIVSEEGVQRFTPGESRTFEVEMLGVEHTIVTAPDGWKAQLNAESETAAKLVVTAPEAPVAAKTARAAADNSRDVAILATRGSFAVISKIQVEAVNPEAEPTVAVSSSATVAPTAATLTFDVAATDAEGWKWICRKSEAAAPDAAEIMASGTEGEGASVTVDGLEAAAAYTLYVVAYAGARTSEVAAAEQTTAEPEADYYQDYLDGKDIQIGSVTINKTTHPDLECKKLSEWNFTNAVLQTGGVFFIDNAEAEQFTIEGASANLARTHDVVLIGRYPKRAQAALTVPELRCNGHVAVKNLHLVATNATTLFNSTNAQTHAGGAVNPDLLLADCTIDLTASRYLVYDNNTAASFGNILLDNSIVEYKAGATNSPALYSITTTVKPSYPMQSITLTNNVIYAETAIQAFLINCGDGKTKYPTEGLQITVTGNTLYNLFQPNIMIRAYILSGLTVTHNVAAFSGVTGKKSYLTGVYDTANFTADRADVSSNYLYMPEPNETDFWSARHTGSYDTPNNRISNATNTDLPVPFAAEQPAKGYFPVNAAAVTIGSEVPGATYDTKLWFDVQ